MMDYSVYGFIVSRNSIWKHFTDSCKHSESQSDFEIPSLHRNTEEA